MKHTPQFTLNLKHIIHPKMNHFILIHIIQIVIKLMIKLLKRQSFLIIILKVLYINYLPMKKMKRKIFLTEKKIMRIILLLVNKKKMENIVFKIQTKK